MFDTALWEIQDTIQHDGQVLIKMATVPRISHNIAQVLGGSATIKIFNRLDTHQTQQSVGRTIEYGDQPAEDCQVNIRRPSKTPCQWSRIGDGQILWVELPENDLNQRREPQCQNGSNSNTDAGRNTDPAEQGSQAVAHEGFSHIADQQTGHGNTQLGTREHKRGSAGDLQSPLRSLIPF